VGWEIIEWQHSLTHEGRGGARGGHCL